MLAHLSRPPKNFDYMNGYIERIAVNTVWDRFALDSLAYRQCDDHPCSMTPLKYDLVQAAVTQACGFQVVLWSSRDEIVARYRERGDLMYSWDHIVKVNSEFSTICGDSEYVVRGRTYRPRVDMSGSVTDPSCKITTELVVQKYTERLNEFLELQ
jgi:hypothetical protein